MSLCRVDNSPPANQGGIPTARVGSWSALQFIRVLKTVSNLNRLAMRACLAYIHYQNG